jgi:hypothetical protein
MKYIARSTQIYYKVLNFQGSRARQAIFYNGFDPGIMSFR